MLLPRLSVKSSTFFFYLIILSLVGMGIAWIASAPLGPGVGTDAVEYLSSSENLVLGRGLIDFNANPLYRWPPLYPLILALLAFITKSTTFNVGWYLNILLYGAMIWLGGILLYKSFQEQVFWAYLGSLVIVSSSSLLSLAVTINTDLLFIIFAWGFLIIAGAYLISPTNWKFLALAVLANLAAFNRLTGATLALTGFIMILWVHRKNLRKGFVLGFIFVVISLLSIVSWIVIHNYLLHSQFVGVYDMRPSYFLDNLYNTLTKITNWFILYTGYPTGKILSPMEAARHHLAGIAPGVVLVCIFSLLLFTNRRKGWQRFAVIFNPRTRFFQSYIFSSTIFLGSYLLFLFATANPTDTSYPEYDRYQIVILPCVLALIFSVLEASIFSFSKEYILRGPFLRQPLILNIRPSTLYLAFGAFFLLWLIYPIPKTYQYVRVTRQVGDTRYNMYNIPAYRQSELVRAAQEISRQSGLTFYSNYPAAAWFYLHRDVFPSPRSDTFMEGDTWESMQEFQGWPGDKPGYLIWFSPNTYRHVLKVKTLKEISNLTQVYRGKDGQIFYVEAFR